MRKTHILLQGQQRLAVNNRDKSRKFSRLGFQASHGPGGAALVREQQVCEDRRIDVDIRASRFTLQMLQLTSHNSGGIDLDGVLNSPVEDPAPMGAQVPQLHQRPYPFTELPPITDPEPARHPVLILLTHEVEEEREFAEGHKFNRRPHGEFLGRCPDMMDDEIFVDGALQRLPVCLLPRLELGRATVGSLPACLLVEMLLFDVREGASAGQDMRDRGTQPGLEIEESAEKDLAEPGVELVEARDSLQAGSLDEEDIAEQPCLRVPLVFGQHSSKNIAVAGEPVVAVCAQDSFGDDGVSNVHPQPSPPLHKIGVIQECLVPPLHRHSAIL